MSSRITLSLLETNPRDASHFRYTDVLAMLKDPAMYPTPRSHRPLIMGRNGAVGANHPMAAQAGVNFLGTGGKGLAASVAVALALGVGEPMMSGLGGDGFYHVFMGGTGEATVFNGRDRKSGV